MSRANDLPHRLNDLPEGLDDFPGTLVYRSPLRTRDTVKEKNYDVIEVSDDEPEVFQAVRFPPAGQRKASREVISIDSASDADGSEMDVVVLPPRLNHKRSRTDHSSLDGSPHTIARKNGKRRATPADPHAIMGAARLQIEPYRYSESPAFDTTNPMAAISSRYPGSSLGAQRKKKSPKKREAEEAPYYVDGRLEVKMYRGPGYARFPVALGTVEGQQELCDKWDADFRARSARYLEKLERQQRERAQLDAYTILDTESESEEDSGAEKQAAFEERCLENVLEIFPDISRAFVLKKIREAPPESKLMEGDDDLVAFGPPPVAEKIIEEVLEMQSYPKERAANSMASGKGAADDGTGINITWDRTFYKNEMYRKDATILIAKHFPHVPTLFVDNLVKEKNSIFDTYLAIHELEDQYFTMHAKPYPRRKQPRIDLEKKYMLKASDHRIPMEYAHRVNELQAAKQHVEREAIKDAAKKAKGEAEAQNLAEHIQSGAIIECQCCFDDETPLNRAVPCTAEVSHNFCFTCVTGLADTQVGMLKHEMLCMDAGGCTAKLSREDVGRAIPITTFDRLELNQQQADIIAANIEGLEQCPSCDYKAICGEVKEEPIFYCQNPDCSRATCRKCQKDDHSPKTCEEAGVDKVLSARHLIEEARSSAIIRTCRKCKAKIVKEYGCNKMSCTRCGSLFCYNCNEDITHLSNNAYSHFGQKCILYDLPGRDRHEKEAAEAEKDAISKAKAMDGELDESKLRIETGKTSEPGARTQAMENLMNHPAGGVFMQDLNNRAARLNNNQVEAQNMQQRIEQLEALQPGREFADIMAGVRAMNGAFDMDNIPPPQVRMQQMQQLQELQRRALANLAQRQQARLEAPRQQARLEQPVLDPGRPARRGRALARPPPADRVQAALEDQLDIHFQDHAAEFDAWGWAGRERGPFDDVPDWAGPPPAMPLANIPPFHREAAADRIENPQMAQRRAVLAQAAARRQATRAQLDAQRQAAQAQLGAGQLAMGAMAQFQGHFGGGGMNFDPNGQLPPGVFLPVGQFQAFRPNNAPGGMDGGRRRP